MTLLIKNVRLIDGETDFLEKRDVFINGDKISAIGNFHNKSADEIVDGNGAYLSPGFIDVNTDSDHYLSLFEHPAQEDFLRQGVTTIIGGMCGSSLAPLIYGSLESVQKWGDINKVNVDWTQMGELLSLLERKPLAVNFGTLVGHSTIRRAIIGEQIRDLTKNELQVFGETLEKALADGGLGLSTGLGYVHAAKTPYSEIKFLAEIVKKYGGVYATHLRKNGADLVESVEETIRLAGDTGVKTIISHFVPVAGFEKEYEKAIQKIDSLSGNVDFNFDIYPSETMVFPLYIFLPDWAKNGGLEVMHGNIKDEWTRSKILKDLAEINPKHFVVAQAPGNEFLIGRSLQDLVFIYSVFDYREALLKLMLATNLRASIFYKNINHDLAEKSIFNKRAFIASNAASYPYSGTALKPERAVSTFTRFLELAIKTKEITLRDAVKKITLEPAKKFDLPKIGLIKDGNFADLTMFLVNAKSPSGVVEIKATIVRGKLAVQDGIFKNKFPGQPIKHRK